MPFKMIGCFPGVAYRETDRSMHVDVVMYAERSNIVRHPQEDRELWIVAMVASAARVMRQKFPECPIRKVYIHIADE